jgi:hypothetical protein
MVRLRRSEQVTRLSHADTSVALTEAKWSLTVGGAERGGGFSYRAPSSVVVDGIPPTSVHDYVMIARIGALAATTAILLRSFKSRKQAITGVTNRRKLS